MIGFLWPILVFRPIVERHGELFRFAEGAWLPDDGEPDLAFYGNSMAYGIELPNHRDIVWSWIDGHWSQENHSHPRLNPWHYALRPGATDWGPAGANARHPNTLAKRSAMNACASRYRVANGRGPDVNKWSAYHERGLILHQNSGERLRPPERATCMYCGAPAPMLCVALSPLQATEAGR